MPSLAQVARESQDAWNAYILQTRPLWQEKRHPALQSRQIVFGVMPKRMAEVLTETLKGAPKEKLNARAVEPWAVTGAYKQDELDELNDKNDFCVLSESVRVVLGIVLEYLMEPVAQVLGCPWRVLNVRAWETLAVADGGPAKWHTDGGPGGMLKIMLYPNGGGLIVDAGADKKSEITGKGIWALFYNSMLHHSAVTFPGRVVAEITLVPAAEFDLAPHSCGQNGKYPILP